MAAAPLYCVCRQPYDVSRFMIECDICKDWFHGRYGHKRFPLRRLSARQGARLRSRGFVWENSGAERCGLVARCGSGAGESS
ncbi:hypothetical protein Z043_110930 [Scleropages formosus]|uniref:Uncharacterized protein n=1 Tax=Scleropages formosus TaxID=113540 RepID=A0A0P7V627_SCLFO|nr:hypothetical protein Z043_110930 [Scleropages formosus]